MRRAKWSCNSNVGPSAHPVHARDLPVEHRRTNAIRPLMAGGREDSGALAFAPGTGGNASEASRRVRKSFTTDCWQSSGRAGSKGML
jgi:hypothetical protein